MNTVDQWITCPACGFKNPSEARFCQNDAYPLQEGDPNDPLVGRLVGNYRLIKRKGEGGFGVVYLAEHQELKNNFAIKILHPQFSANRHIAERFRREALAAGRMRHEHIVFVADFGFVQGVGHYYAMEYLQGKTLKEALDDGEDFSPERILNIATQVTSAMARVHSQRIIHRDLKPENIFLLNKNGIDDYVKLVDFGIAKVMDEGGVGLTRTGLSVGTPLYMSPEQARGQLDAISTRTDIYSWGIILYEILTNRPPFYSDNPHDVVMMQICKLPPPLAETDPSRQFTPELEDLIRRSLAKDPNDRPPTMEAFFMELQQIFTAPRPPFIQLSEDGSPLRLSAEEEIPTTLMEYTPEYANPEVVGDVDESLLRETAEGLVSSDENELRETIEGLTSKDPSSLRETAEGLVSSEENQLPPPPQALQEKAKELGRNIEEGNLSDTDTPNWKVPPKEQEPSRDELPTTPQNLKTIPAEAKLEPKSEAKPYTVLAPPLPEQDLTSEEAKAPPLGKEDLPSQELYGSFSTDPKALRSSTQGFWVIGGIVLGLLVLFFIGRAIYQSMQPEPNINFDPSPIPSSKKPHQGLPSLPPIKRTKTAKSSQQQDKLIKKTKGTIAPVKPKSTALSPQKKKVDRRAPTHKQYKLKIRIHPKARCSVRIGKDLWERITSCQLQGIHGSSVTVKMTRRGYHSLIKTWLPTHDTRWHIKLRRKAKSRTRSRWRNNTKVKQRNQPRKRPPASRKKDDIDIFDQTDNPFRTKK